jgi:hypothetical protein
VRCHFDEEERPAMVRLHVVRDEIVDVARHLGLERDELLKELTRR